MPDVSFAGLRRHQLDPRSWVDHVPGWLGGSDEVFALLLAEARWTHRDRWMYDRRVPEPRLTARWAEQVGPDGPPEPLPTVAALLSERYGVAFERIAVNLYRDGQDSVAWHGDRIAQEVVDPMVCTLSLGGRRRFLLRPKGGGTSTRLELGPGDLVVMGGACQREWQHTVPKTARPVGPRMAVTFRHGPRYDEPRG